jgi:pimeloyl-ACP methyl ester carboxylesterase
LLSKANGASEEAIARYRAFQQRMFAVLKSEPDSEVAETKIRQIVDEEMAGLSQQERARLATTTIVADGRYLRTHRGELSPWFRFFLTHDPRATLRSVKCPVLAIFCENDLFVPPAAHLAATEAAVRAGGNARSAVIELPGLNHMFQTATTEANEKYRETIAPIALKTMADWIEQQAIQR